MGFGYPFGDEQAKSEAPIKLLHGFYSSLKKTKHQRQQFRLNVCAVFGESSSQAASRIAANAGNAAVSIKGRDGILDQMPHGLLELQRVRNRNSRRGRKVDQHLDLRSSHFALLDVKDQPHVPLGIDGCKLQLNLVTTCRNEVVPLTRERGSG